jgi:SAM-dependent methyltransferase
MSTKDDLLAAYQHLRNGDLRAALVELDLPTRAAAARERAEQTMRRAWMKYALRTVRQNDAHDRLDLAYKMPDPWHMASAQEQARFAETNAVIARELGEQFGSLLEIGCGEGHQTEHLATLAARVTGLDVSATAIERARRRLGRPRQRVRVRGRRRPRACRGPRSVGRFELVTACEVIYYMSDMPRFLAHDGSPGPGVPGHVLRAGGAQGRGARRRDARRRVQSGVPLRRRRVGGGVVARGRRARRLTSVGGRATRTRTR